MEALREVVALFREGNTCADECQRKRILSVYLFATHRQEDAARRFHCF